MSEKYLIGVDLGTTAIKAALFNSKGKKVAAQEKEHKLLTPAALTVEQSADVYWDTFCHCVKSVAAQAKVDKNDIAAISLSAQGETIVFLDKENKPLHNFIVWMDTRPQKEAEIINSWFSSDEILHVTGQGPITSLYPACKVLWMKRNHPEIFEKTARIMLLDDYIFFRMGGVFNCEGSNWCTSYMFDINTGKYWPEMLKKLEVREEQLPTPVETATPLGTIHPSIAEDLGLSSDTMMVMGGLDQSCGTIGVGNVKAGIFSESTGAALVICTMTDHIVLDEGGELPCFYGVIPGLYMLHAGAKGGIIYKWLRDTLCKEEMELAAKTGKSAYKIMDELAATIPAGSDGLIVLPFFGGAGAPSTDQYAKGMIYGLGIQHTKAHLIRAFMEATALNIYRMVEYCEEVTGKPVTEIRSLGGGAKGSFWCQLKADMLGRPVVTMKNTQDAACLGAAIIAGVGAGIFPSVEETASSLVEIENVYLPNPENRAAYDEQIRQYKILEASLKGKTEQLQ